MSEIDLNNPSISNYLADSAFYLDMHAKQKNAKKN